MTRRDVVIIDILILLSSASTPLISFVSSLSVSLALSSTFLLRPAFTSSFYQSVILSSSLPSRFFILVCLSIVPVLSYTALLLLPSSSSTVFLLFFHPAFCAYPVIISSPFLLVFFYRFAPLLRFSLLSTSYCVYLPVVVPSFSILLLASSPSSSVSFILCFRIFSIFLCSLLSLSLSLDSHLLLLYTRWYAREIRHVIVGCEYLTDTRSFLSIKGLHVPLTEWPNACYCCCDSLASRIGV